MIDQEVLLLNPFPGLRAFRSKESELFFGRDGQSDQVLTKLHAARFVAVVGTSGSGKSSLVSAGLLPALLSGHMPSAGSSWRIANFRPGSSPIRNLAEALNARDVFGTSDKTMAGDRLENIERTLRRSSLGLLEVVSQSKLAAGENLLILADQFEELFRFRKNSTAEHPEDEAAAFVKLLLEAKQSDKKPGEKLPIYVILTMRSDYLGDCAHFWGLPEAINEGQFLIPRMTDDNRREAIIGPVIMGGGEITAPLVNRLLNDAGDDPAQLPILQHALMRTWEYWKNICHAAGPLDIPHYLKIGGMSEALSKHADEAFMDLSPQLQEVAGKVFKALTEKEADNREGRRPATVAEIAAAAEAGEEQVRTVIESFRREDRSFLMPPPPEELTSDKLIDISHESLIRGWVRLRAWVDEEAEAARQYVRLADTAALFPDQESYLRDPALSNGLKWLKDNKPTRAWAERYDPGFDKTIEYLELSKQNRQAEIDEKERAHKEKVEQELHHAEAIAAGEMRRVKLRNWGLVALSLLLIGMIGATAYAFQQKSRAETSLKDVAVERDNAKRAQAAEKEQKVTAERAQTAAERATLRVEIERDNARKAEEETKRQRDAAEHQRGEAVKQAKIAQAATIEADRQKKAAVTALATATKAQGETAAATKKALEKGQEASALYETVQEIDRSAPYFGGIMRGHKQSISNAWFAGASNSLVTASPSDRIVTQSVDGTSRQWYSALGSYVGAPAFADGLYSKTLSLALLTKYPGREGTVVMDLVGQKEFPDLPWTDTAADNTMISPDGKTILHLDKLSGEVWLYDPSTGHRISGIEGHYLGKLPPLVFSADSRLLVNTDWRNSSGAVVSEVATGRNVVALTGHLGEINSFGFSRDNKFVVTASKDGTARIWDPLTGNTVLQLSGHGGPVNSASFSDDGRYIVTTSDRRAFLWEAKSPAWKELTEASPTTLVGHTDTVTNAAFSPDGKWVVTISQDRTAQLWDARVASTFVLGVSSGPSSSPSVAVFRGHIKSLTSVDISSDSNYVVTGSEDKTARVWDLRSFGEFNVADAQLAATAPEYGGQCPANVKLNGTISVAGRSGMVEYKFVRSDGSESLPQVLTFDGPGSKEVSDTRQLYSPGVSRAGRPLPLDGWVEIEILTPKPMKSKRASFVVKCGDDDFRFLVRRNLTASELQQIMPAASDAQRALYLPYLQKAMDEFGINTPLRQAAFLAEVAYNSVELTHMVEVGTADLFEKRYGSRKDLGNFEAGDGALFKGRGAFQLTGRAQYQAVGAQLGVDLIADPEKAAAPEVAFRTAALYWQKNGLNEKAEESLLPEIHRRMGGRSGLQAVQAYYDRAKRVLGVP